MLGLRKSAPEMPPPGAISNGSIPGEPSESDYCNLITDALKNLESGREPDLTELPEDLAGPLKRLAKAIFQRDSDELATMVAFSTQASDSMAAVARITGEVREIDSYAQTMSAAIEELNVSTEQISETARVSSEEMQSARSLMIEGTELVVNTSSAAQTTFSAMETTKEEAEQVAAAVDQIAEFVGTIEAIAQQTNLLALNATIEAARAGEAGRGFAVVAAEVKALSAETRTATEDISSRIEGLQNVVANLVGSIDGARESVAVARDLTEDTRQKIASVEEVVVVTSSRMDEIAGVLSEQTQATQELATGVSKIATGSREAATRANEVIEAVRQSEKLVDRGFAALDGREIHDYVLHRAKSDHFLWKKRLSEMLVGLTNLTADELADHHSCRLGKWYGAVADEDIKRHPAFAKLSEPHAAVHTFGKQAAACFATGDRLGAQELVAKMDVASVEVTQLLDELLSR